MHISKIPVAKIPPYDINAIIEVPLGGDPVQYEMDRDSGAMFTDRLPHTAMRYPCNHGFVPHTLSLDGGPVEVRAVGPTPLAVGCVMRSRPVGVLMIEDEAGAEQSATTARDI